MVYIVAIITAQPGKRAELLAAFAQNVANVHAEPGCIAYTATVDADGFSAVQAQLGPDTFAVIETWADADAFNAHLSAPHMAAYSAATKPLVAARTLHVLSPAGVVAIS